MANESNPVFANPTPLGLIGFGLTTAMLSLTNAQWWVFLTLWVVFFLLGFGDLLGADHLTQAGGVGIVSGLLAMYTSFALVANSTFGRTILPLGTR